jgi:hypothetical protein
MSKVEPNVWCDHDKTHESDATRRGGPYGAAATEHSLLVRKLLPCNALTS